MSFKRVKGCEDYYPEEQAARAAVANILKQEAEKFGFLEIDMPALESVKLLTAKSGEEIKEQIFLLTQRGSEELGLRFDLTIPIARMYIERQKQLQKPVKWYSLSNMWRYEAPQKGRQREFSQLSVELFGSNKPESDALCINLLISCMKALKLGKDVMIKINNRKLLEGLLLEVAPQEKLAEIGRIIDKSGKIGPVEFMEELKKVGLDLQQIEVVKKIVACRGNASILSSIKKELNPNALATEGLEELENTLKLINSELVTVDLSVARGLAYYTGNVFECFDKQGKYRSLAGGGRYDQLVELLGGLKESATGFAIGMETLSLLLKGRELMPKVDTGPEYYIAPVNEEMIPKAIEIANSLRKKTSVDIDIMRRKLSKQFDYANAIGAKKVVIVGEKDIKEGKVTVRELLSGKEQKLDLSRILQ